MAKQIFINTKTTLITDTEPIKPTSPCWTFVNTGTAKLIVNGYNTLLPNGSFNGGIEPGIYALLVSQGFEVKNETTLQISFLDVSKADVVEKTQGRGTLIEQFIRIA